MREQAADLAIEHADELRAARDLQAKELLRRKAERMLLIHRRDVIEPVEIRDRLQIGLLLDQLLGAAMQETDMWVHTFDNLAVQFQNETQNAMSRRMLRSK